MYGELFSRVAEEEMQWYTADDNGRRLPEFGMSVDE